MESHSVGNSAPARGLFPVTINDESFTIDGPPLINAGLMLEIAWQRGILCHDPAARVYFLRPQPKTGVDRITTGQLVDLSRHNSFQARAARPRPSQEASPYA